MLEEYIYKSICVRITYQAEYVQFMYGNFGKNKKGFHSLNEFNTLKLQVIIERSI